MIRKAFVMTVNADAETEYERRHNPIWPQMQRVLRDHGVASYSIFLHAEKRLLFAYVELEDEARWAAIAQTPECREWWLYMAEVMPHHADKSPIAESVREVFHLE